VTRWGDFDRDVFLETYFSWENTIDLEKEYVDAVETTLLKNEAPLLWYIATLAPKFDLETLPVIHILILMIALTEMLYMTSLEIPRAVSVNEAIELAKRFSDDGGREFINGTLSTFLKDDTIETKNTKFTIFHK
jgi:transcription antitermination protein NusB